MDGLRYEIATDRIGRHDPDEGDRRRWAEVFAHEHPAVPYDELAERLGIQTSPLDACEHCHESLHDGSHGAGVCAPNADGTVAPVIPWYKPGKAQREAAAKKET